MSCLNRTHFSEIAQLLLAMNMKFVGWLYFYVSFNHIVEKRDHGQGWYNLDTIFFCFTFYIVVPSML